MLRLLFSCAVVAGLSLTVYAQERDGPALPIILEHADSVVGSGPISSGTREFVGHVRFTQGNVTVECERALHNVSANTVELFTNVRIVQQGLVLTAPYVTYSGASNVAVATRGVVVRENGSTIQARHATYSTISHIVVFRDSVTARDSAQIWADTLVFDRDADTTVARGHVLIVDSAQRIVAQSAYAYRDPSRRVMHLRGDAAVWQWTDRQGAQRGGDTLFLEAQSITSLAIGESTIYNAMSGVVLTQGSVAARCDSLVADRGKGSSDLYGTPVVWSGDMQLHADTITARSQGDQLRSVVGRGAAILVSRSDSMRTDRIDQIAGAVVTMDIEQDTVRSLEATGDAQSITFRSEDQRGEGLAKVASDTIRVQFDQGQLTDVRWLGGVEGEHHPEPVVAGRAETYRLPQFRWRTDRPVARKLPRIPVVRARK